MAIYNAMLSLVLFFQVDVELCAVIFEEVKDGSELGYRVVVVRSLWFHMDGFEFHFSVAELNAYVPKVYVNLELILR